MYMKSKGIVAFPLGPNSAELGKKHYIAVMRNADFVVRLSPEGNYTVYRAPRQTFVAEVAGSLEAVEEVCVKHSPPNKDLCILIL